MWEIGQAGLDFYVVLAQKAVFLLQQMYPEAQSGLQQHIVGEY